METEQTEQITKLPGLIESMLKILGEDTQREGLQKTPHRVARALPGAAVAKVSVSATRSEA